MPREKDRKSQLNYKTPTKELVYKQSTQGGNNREWYIKEDTKTFTPKVGKKGNSIRLCPGTWKGKEYWGYEIKVHFDIGPDKAAYLCAKDMKHGDCRCPVCEERARAQRYKTSDEEYIKSLSPVKRVAAYIIDRHNEDEGVLLWVMPYTVDKEIMKHVINKRTGVPRPLDHPDIGHDVYFEREGEKLQTKYSGFEIDTEKNALDDEIIEYIIDNPVPTALQWYDYDHIKSVFMAGTEEEEDKSKKKKKVVEDEDEDEEEDKPKKKKKVVEEEEEEEDLPTWAEVHEMRRRKLEQLALDKTDIEVEDMEDIEDDVLADKICKELDIKNPKKKKVVEEDEDEEEEKPKKKDKQSSARERLRKLRKNEDEDEDE